MRRDHERKSMQSPWFPHLWSRFPAVSRISCARTTANVGLPEALPDSSASGSRGFSTCAVLSYPDLCLHEQSLTRSAVLLVGQGGIAGQDTRLWVTLVHRRGISVTSLAPTILQATSGCVESLTMDLNAITLLRSSYLAVAVAVSRTKPQIE